jgi:predicted metal-dependent hydrolase
MAKEVCYLNKIVLDNKEYEYIIQYKRIKNIYMRVKDNKIYISSPKKVSIKEIERFIIQKEKWILNVIKKQEEYKDREKEIEARRVKKYTDEEFINIIKVSVDKYSSLMNLFPNKVKIKDMKYAWGSCTSNKNISFNSELIYFEKEIIEYVIVHELSHLKYMNHQKEFWNLVERYIPNHKYLRKELKTYKRREEIS